MNTYQSFLENLKKKLETEEEKRILEEITAIVKRSLQTPANSDKLPVRSSNNDHWKQNNGIPPNPNRLPLRPLHLANNP